MHSVPSVTDALRVHREPGLTPSTCLSPEDPGAERHGDDEATVAQDPESGAIESRQSYRVLYPSV